MATTVKRLFILSSVGLVLALILGGSGAPARPSMAQTPEATPEAASAEPPAATLPSARPVIRAEVDGATVEGLPGSYCWPQPAPSAQCDLVDDPQPTESIPVTEGTTVQFLVDPASPAPAGWRAILLDDKGPDGNPRQIDLNDGTFMVEGLTPGSHRLVAQAIYTGEDADNQPYVEYVFLLQVGEAVAMATEAATEIPTEEATPEVVVPPLIPTDTPAAPIETVEVTPEATLESTAEGPAETPVVTTPEAPGTEEPTVETSQPVSTAEVAPTIIPSPTEAPTATVVPPTAVPVPTEQPTLAPVATEAAAPSTAPAQAIIVGGQSYDPIAVNACLQGPTEVQPCTTRPYNAAAARIVAAPGDTAQVVFKGPRPTAITVSVLSADGLTRIYQQALPPDNLVLYILQDMPGNFVLSVEIVWPQGKATYFYRLTIGS